MAKSTRLKYSRNKQELIAQINQSLEGIFNGVGEKALEELRNQIEKDVYGGIPTYNQQYYGGKYGDDMAGFHEPTYEFLDAWNFRTAKNMGNPKITLYFVPSSLDKKAHKSLVDGSDPRKNLADILNNAYSGYGDGYTSSLAVGGGIDGMTGAEIPPTMVSKFRKPYWTRFLKRLTKDGLMRKLIKEEAKKIGLDLT